MSGVDFLFFTRHREQKISFRNDLVVGSESLTALDKCHVSKIVGKFGFSLALRHDNQIEQKKKCLINITLPSKEV